VLFRSIHSDDFGEIEESSEIGPSLQALDGSKVFVGKLIPREKLTYGLSSAELIGYVTKNSITREWELIVTYGTAAFIYNKNFLVLSIPNPDSYEWIKESGGKVPKFAFRAAADLTTNEFLFVGRTIIDDDKTGRYYSHQTWQPFERAVEAFFGKVHSSHRCLYTSPDKEKEILYENYEVLCMKPSATSLRNLCQLAIRKTMQYEDERISRLQLLIPQFLVDFLKNAKYLNCNDCLLSGEKIVTECGKFELYINKHRTIVCRNNQTNEVIAFFFNIESIILMRTHIVLCHSEDHKFMLFEDVDSKYEESFCNYKWVILVENFNKEKPVNTMLTTFDGNNRPLSLVQCDFGPFHDILSVNNRFIHHLIR